MPVFEPSVESLERFECNTVGAGQSGSSLCVGEQHTGQLWPAARDPPLSDDRTASCDRLHHLSLVTLLPNMARMPGDAWSRYRDGGGSCSVADQVLTEAEKAARAKAEKEA